MSCESRIFRNVPLDTFNCMKNKLQSAGINIPSGYKGELSGAGVVVDFKWDGKLTLTITITEKPFFVSYELAVSKIKQLVIECNGS